MKPDVKLQTSFIQAGERVNFVFVRINCRSVQILFVMSLDMFVIFVQAELGNVILLEHVSTAPFERR